MRYLKNIRNYWLILPLAISVIASCNSSVNRQDKLPSVSDTLKSVKSVNPYIALDQSPMDMSYFPNNYPILKMNGTDSSSLVARVIYSRPQKKGRMIMGEAGTKSLREYGKEWRLGANEATEIEFFKNVVINGKTIVKGRYIIYCIPFSDRWTIVLNTNLFTWGLHMDKEKDIFSVNLPVELQAPPLEDFTMIFEPAAYGTDLIIAWDNIKTVLRISTRTSK